MNESLLRILIENFQKQPLPSTLMRLVQNLICPKCFRKVPNKEHFIHSGCKWCIYE